MRCSRYALSPESTTTSSPAIGTSHSFYSVIRPSNSGRQLIWEQGPQGGSSVHEEDPAEQQAQYPAAGREPHPLTFRLPQCPFAVPDFGCGTVTRIKSPLARTVWILPMRDRFSMPTTRDAKEDCGEECRGGIGFLRGDYVGKCRKPSAVSLHRSLITTRRGPSPLPRTSRQRACLPLARPCLFGLFTTISPQPQIRQMSGGFCNSERRVPLDSYSQPADPNTSRKIHPRRNIYCACLPQLPRAS